MVTFFRSVCAGALVSMLLCASAQAQAVQVQPSESRFWIEGTSSVNTFQCRVDTMQGQGRLATSRSSASAAQADSSRPQAHLTIPVRAFDCGKEQMTRDLQEVLQVAEHPTIQFELERAHLKARPDSSDGWYRIEALGYLTIAGTERLVRITALGRKVADHRFAIKGSKTLKMTYFGIEPPTKFMGLIRVHNQITVRFDLAAQSSSSQSSLPVTRSASSSSTPRASQ